MVSLHLLISIQLWSVESIGEERKVTYLSTLSKHTQSVNVVRFCPRGTSPFLITYPRAHFVGETLASAGDDGNILLWIPTDIPATAFGEDHAEDKESWRIKHMIRTNSGAEIYDLAWSPDGQYFITGGMDNTARIFNAHTGTSNHAGEETRH